MCRIIVETLADTPEGCGKGRRCRGATGERSAQKEDERFLEGPRIRQQIPIFKPVMDGQEQAADGWVGEDRPFEFKIG